jgi:phage terminase small subunit
MLRRGPGTPRAPGAGRPRKPIHLMAITGKPGQVPGYSGDSTKFRRTGLEPGYPKPDYLPETAARIWDQIAPACTQMGTLHELSGHMLASYCLLAGRQVERPLTSPEVSELRTLSIMFGLCPLGRQKLGIKI